MHLVYLQYQMTLIRVELPQTVFFGKRKKCGITDVSEISEVLQVGMKLKQPSAVSVGTHFKVNGNGQRMTISWQGRRQCIQTGREAQQR